MTWMIHHHGDLKMTDEVKNVNRSIEDMLIKGINLSKEVKKDKDFCETCKVPMWLSFFFDGTGNNFGNDFKPRDNFIKHSNVAALFAAHLQDPKQLIFKYYYEGIGTPFTFKGYYKPVYNPRTGMKTGSTGWTDSQGSVSQKKNMANGGGMTERLQKAIYQFVERMEQQIKYKTITIVNISAFGFSRGATEARIFMNWIKRAPNVTAKNGKLYYRSQTEIKLKFLGIFDTVESVGLGKNGGNNNRDIYKVKIDNDIEQTVHLVASIELRKTFPLTVTGNLAENIGQLRKQEIRVYPGAHSNVGGGYAKNEQRRYRGLADITLKKMHECTERSGLKFLSLSQMKKLKTWETTYQYMFCDTTESQKQLDKFLAHAKIKSNSVKDHINAHLALYQQWINDGLYSQYINNNIKYLENLRTKNSTDENNLDIFRNIEAVLNVELAEKIRPNSLLRQVNAYKTPNDVKIYIEKYVCDSLGGFAERISGSRAIKGAIFGSLGIGYAMQRYGYVLIDLNRADYFTSRSLINASNLNRG